MKKKLLFKIAIVATALWGTSVGAFAQYQKPKTAVGFNVGTQGVGAEAKTEVFSQLDARLGFNIVPIDHVETTRYLGTNQTTINVIPRFSNVHLLADWHPFKYSVNNTLSGNFKLSAGAAYFIKSQGTATIGLTNNYFYGDIEIPKEEVGIINASAKWSHFAPYASVGLDNIPVFNNFMIGFEMGSYYFNAPKATLVGTGFLADNSQYQPTLQNNLKAYKFLPVFQVNFNFNIK